MAQEEKAAQAAEDAGRQALADIIERRRADIESRWVRVLQAEIVGDEVNGTELRDAIGEYLARTAHLLRRLQPLDLVGSGAWVEVTREHGENRLRLGFNIEELIHEFILLRRVLVAVAQEEGEGGAIQVSQIADLIDAAIGQAVKHYVASRDYASRRAEAEHIGFLTHELRNPLSTAMIAATHLRRHAPPSPGATRALDLLDTAHRRLQGLIDNVLQTERLEAGAEDITIVPTTVGEVLANALAAGREAADAKGLEFHVNLDPAVRLDADLRLCTSAAQNLIDNAVKFTDAGSIEVSVEDRPRDVVVHVRDACGGIGAEDLQRMFEPFRRGRSSKPGTGLGLTIARRAVEAQGGTIQAESTPIGCHFSLTLPKSRR